MTYCCEYFEKIGFQFCWFSYHDYETGTDVFLMPYLTELNGEKIRVNHCPVCGKEIRDIKIPEGQFKKLISHE